ncbi:hypothetical protein TPENAI_60817 [Tenacibaculum litopenaei]|jgi:hypothetical protein|uniref:hypothetical protein n=1 Tax=Tenacibaculum litopenaei TaxID=396016 RepID=UPI0038954F6D
MLKNLSNLGSVLDKKEQQSINGGGRCQTLCYSQHGGAWSANNPHCWDCPIPHML